MGFNLAFFLREAFKNMRLNLLMTTTAMTTTAVCVLILGVAILVSAHVEGIIRNIGENVAISAYFPDDAAQEEIDETRGSIENYPEVKSVTYVSREEALERFRKMMADQPDVAESIGSDNLPASLEIQLNDQRQSEDVAQRLRTGDFAEGYLFYNQQLIDPLNQGASYIVWTLRGFMALLLVASILLIFNTIRLSIFARRKEIEVMKLVGASDDFVRTPFLLEGLVQGLIGAALAALLVLWANTAFVNLAQRGEELPLDLNIYISSDAVNTSLVFLILLAVGGGVGIAGSFLSVRRFLKV